LRKPDLVRSTTIIFIFSIMIQVWFHLIDLTRFFMAKVI
jgi:hypothetical protein